MGQGLVVWLLVVSFNGNIGYLMDDTGEAPVEFSTKGECDEARQRGIDIIQKSKMRDDDIAFVCMSFNKTPAE